MSKSELFINPIPTTEFHLPAELILNISGMQVQIIRITHLKKADKPWQIKNHAHLNWEFHYVISGSGTIATMGNTINVGTRHLYITPPFSLHKQTSNADCLEEYCIECSLIPPISPQTEFSGNELLKFFNYRDTVASNSFVMSNHLHSMHIMLTELLKSDTPSLVRIEGLLVYLISEYLDCVISGGRKKRFSPNDQSHGNQAIAIKNYLDANICNPVTTQDIADLMYMSSRQIDRIFSKQYNMTAFQYLQTLRTKAAVNLINNTVLSFADIAKSTGFSSYRQMVRALHAGGYPTPTELREKNLISSAAHDKL